MNTSLYMQIVHTIAAICLVFIVLKLYSGAVDIGNTRQLAQQISNREVQAYINGGSVTMENANDLAYEIYRLLDGMTVTIR